MLYLLQSYKKICHLLLLSTTLNTLICAFLVILFYRRFGLLHQLWGKNSIMRVFILFISIVIASAYGIILCGSFCRGLCSLFLCNWHLRDTRYLVTNQIALYRRFLFYSMHLASKISLLLDKTSVYRQELHSIVETLHFFEFFWFLAFVLIL